MRTMGRQLPVTVRLSSVGSVANAAGLLGPDARPEQGAEIKFEGITVLDVLSIRSVLFDKSVKHSDPRVRYQLGTVSIDPSGGISPSVQTRDAQGVHVQCEHRGGATWRSLVMVAKRTDQVDRSSHEGRSVEVGWRKHRFGIAVYLEPTARIMDKNIVVDAEVRII